MTTLADTTQEQPTQQGAPVGNRNAERHGARRWRTAIRFGLTNIPLPDGCFKIESNINAFRRSLEDAVLAARGAISVIDAGTINRAARMEAWARTAARSVAKEGDEMTPETRRLYQLDVVKGTVERDRAMADLGIEQRQLAGLWALDTENGNG